MHRYVVHARVPVVFVCMESSSKVCALTAGDIQWSLSVADTMGAQLAVLYRDVSLI